MEKKSVWKLILGEWNTKTVVGVALGAALFGVLMRYASFPVFANTYITAAMIVPVIIGGLFGPVPAFIACMVGNMISDVLWGGFWLDWSIGNGVLGFLVGTLPLYGAFIDKGIFEIKHMVIFALIAVFGNILAFGIITPILTVLLYGGELSITLIQSTVASVANIAVLIVVGIPLLKYLASRNLRTSNLSRE
jgi:energy-coupling factor transport system substrate-specific component